MQTVNLAALLLAIVILGAFVAIEAAGHRLGQRTRTRRTTPAADGQFATIQAALLGLLGLLLGFGFSGGMTRFTERRQTVVQEANAIGTAFLRADLLEEPFRTNLRTALADYADARAAMAELPDIGLDEYRARSKTLHGTMWSIAVEGVERKPATLMAVLPAVNDVIDSHTVRWSIMHRHAPWVAMIALLATAIASLFSVGYGFGLSQNPNRWIARTCAVTIAIVLWICVDLDYPRVGLIRLDERVLHELRDDLRENLGEKP
jgi:protein-S-isoprenylcysteine O-methyltransferase Ste14